ncbi:MAG: cation transporter [Bacteroidales bacterium]
MKTIPGIISFMVAAIIAVIISCNSGGKKAVVSESSDKIQTVEVSIAGMTCTGCEQTIQAGVSKIDGVKSIKATFTDGRAVVEYDAMKADTAAIRTAITGAGYRVNSFSFPSPADTTGK